jgi:hypothetical protein
MHNLKYKNYGKKKKVTTIHFSPHNICESVIETIIMFFAHLHVTLETGNKG